jgi:hypothetical protein
VLWWRVEFIGARPPTAAKTALQSSKFADFADVMAFGTNVTARSTGTVGALGHLCARSTRLAESRGLVGVLPADAFVRAPEGEAITGLALTLLGHARSTTPIAWHDLVSCIVLTELVEMLIVHVLSPFLERAKNDMRRFTIPVLMPTEWAPAYLIGSH